MITFFGIAEPDGTVTSPIGTAADGTPIYQRTIPQGFLIVVEMKRGPSNKAVGLQTFNWAPDDPNLLPDLQMVTSRALGNGSSKVCDAVTDPPGGVPATDPPAFSGSQTIADRVNDLGCRFDARNSNGDACTVAPITREPRFANSQSTAQFCSSPGVGAEMAFPHGDTRLTVRGRDTVGQPGFPTSIIVRVP